MKRFSPPPQKIKVKDERIYGGSTIHDDANASK